MSHVQACGIASGTWVSCKHCTLWLVCHPTSLTPLFTIIMTFLPSPTTSRSPIGISLSAFASQAFTSTPSPKSLLHDCFRSGPGGLRMTLSNQVI